MRILLTGANGYIGTRLLPALVEVGHEVIALVRSKRRLNIAPHLQDKVQVVVGDLHDPSSLCSIPKNIDAAYYLVHSMGGTASGFASAEEEAADNFQKVIQDTECQQIIYLGGLASGDALSEHMASRQNVEDVLRRGEVPVTVLRAGIIIGSGSASFEIIRDLVEKLPVMVAPRWVSSKCQPIAIADVLHYLRAVLGQEISYGETYEIGGPEILSYRDILLTFAKVRKLHRLIIPVPVLTPRLSSYWLFFITSTNFALAQALVDSLKTDAVCSNKHIHEHIPHSCLSYEAALKRAFAKIEQNAVVSSWKDAVVQSRLSPQLAEYIEVPKHGCLNEIIERPYTEKKAAIDTLWRIGGKNGWYYMNWAWKLRGALDKAFGGSGLGRGRRNPDQLQTGDVLDFWRVLLADRENGHLLLYAEMRVPGEAWLEYRIQNGTVTQTATFRPRGLLGRLYWYGLMPFHHFIFRGLCSAIARGINSDPQS